MLNAHARRLLITAIALPSTGCVARHWRPQEPSPVAATTQSTNIKFADYLQANRIGRWVYDRIEVQPGPNRAAGTYARRITVKRIQEGVLENKKLLPLERYLQTSTPSAERAPRTNYPLGRERWGIFFDLAEPMDPFPPELEGNQPVSSSTTIRYYDQSGKQADAGTLTREAQIEGFETVECPAGTFENCVRIRVDLLIRFRWGPQIDWKGYVWLSPTAGEVRRVQKMSGWYWIFWFGSAHEYLLTSYEPIDAAFKPAALPTAWARAAMVLDRVIPHPLIAGLVVDFADNPAAMTKPAE